MGKKKRKVNSILDIESSSQTDILDALYRLEKNQKGGSNGDGILGLGKVSNKKQVADNGLPMELNDAIENDIKEDHKRYKKERKEMEQQFIAYMEDDDDDTNPQIMTALDQMRMSKQQPMVNKSVQVKRPSVKENKPQTPVAKNPAPVPVNKPVPKEAPMPKIIEKPNVRSISFTINEDIMRGIIDDGIIANPVILDGVATLDVPQPEGYTDDDFEEYGLYCLQFAYMTKHPAAIIDVDEFFNAVGDANSYNTDKFMLMLVDDKVFAYVIEDTDKFDMFAEVLGYASKTVSPYVFAANAAIVADICSRPENAFWFHDDYIKQFMKTFNNVEGFMDLFLNDPETGFDESFDGFMVTVGFESFFASIAKFITDILSGIPKNAANAFDYEADYLSEEEDDNSDEEYDDFDEEDDTEDDENEVQVDPEELMHNIQETVMKPVEEAQEAEEAELALEELEEDDDDDEDDEEDDKVDDGELIDDSEIETIDADKDGESRIVTPVRRSGGH